MWQPPPVPFDVPASIVSALITGPNDMTVTFDRAVTVSDTVTPDPSIADDNGQRPIWNGDAPGPVQTAAWNNAGVATAVFWFAGVDPNLSGLLLGAGSVPTT